MSNLQLATQLEAIEREAVEMEAAARLAAQNGMYESGAGLRNRAAGLRRALLILTEGGGDAN